MEHRIIHGSLPELTHEQVDSHILDLQTHGVLPLLAQEHDSGGSAPAVDADDAVRAPNCQRIGSEE